MLRDILSLLGILLVIVLVLGGSYVFTRWAGRRLPGGVPAGAGGERLRLLDRIPVGRDQFLLVARVGRRIFVLGSSPGGLTLLAELSEEEGAQWQSPPESPQKAPDFGALLRQLRERNGRG